MSISIVMRLVPEALVDGRLVGEVELVSSGERTKVASADELVGFLATRLPLDDSSDVPPGALG